MIEIRKDALVFSFPEVHKEAKCSLVFQRTLRVPQARDRYPVPPGLGRFHLRPVDEFDETSPPHWIRGDSVFFPMYQAEALWIIFIGWYPFAIKVTAGDTNAITGKRLRDERLWRPQDYMVVPRNPWMEWFCIGNGQARQFVAMPLRNMGKHEDSIENIRITLHPMKSGRYRELREKRTALMRKGAVLDSLYGESGAASGWFNRHDSKLGDYGLGTWKLDTRSQCSVYPVNSRVYSQITGNFPPGKPPTAEIYSEAGLPWFPSYSAEGEFCNPHQGWSS